MFGVWCLGFRDQGAGRGVQGAGCRAQGAGCKVQGAWCRVQGAGCRVWAPGASSLLRVIEAAPNSKEAARDPPPPSILRARVQVMSPP